MSAPILHKSNPVFGLSAAVAVHALMAVLVMVTLRPQLKPILLEPTPVMLIKETPAPKAEVKPLIAAPIRQIVVPVLPIPEVKVEIKPVVDLPRLPDRPNAITLPSPAPPPPPAAVPSQPDKRELDFQGKLMAHLNSLKRYPFDARRAGTTGVVMVRFRIDRHGHVLNYRIEQGSGHAVLDEETSRLMQRIDPCPAPPDSMPGAEFEFLVPVQYKLG